MRARGRGVHDDGARARSRRSPSRRCDPRPSPRSPTSSDWTSTSCPPTTARGSGPSGSTPRSPPGERRRPSHPTPRVGSPAGWRGNRRSRARPGRAGPSACPDLLVAELRFSEHAAIEPHSHVRDAIVVCIAGEGFTSVGEETVALREGQQVRWPQGVVHGLWTEASTMADAHGRAHGLERKELLGTGDGLVLGEAGVRLRRHSRSRPRHPRRERARSRSRGRRCPVPCAWHPSRPRRTARLRRPRRRARSSAGSARSPTPSAVAPRPPR